MVHRAYFSSPTFSAGLIETFDGDLVRFRGKFFAAEGEAVSLVGHWCYDPRYGEQLDVSEVRFDLPDTPEGLRAYLAGHPAFRGVGEKTAERLVAHAGTADRLDAMLRDGLERLHTALRIPMRTLRTLQEAWIANAERNRLYGYLFAFGLTARQVEKLIDSLGDGVVGVLKENPYLIIEHLSGYGFKRVDGIARKMGIPKDHAGRIRAAIKHCLHEQIRNGHTWVQGADLVRLADDALVMDELDSRQHIAELAREMLESEDLAADGTAVTTPLMLRQERLVWDSFRAHAEAGAGALLPADADDMLTAEQMQAYRAALSGRICVISGAAGTGKTHALSRLTRAFEARGKSIKLCSPTGKAAKRIEQALRNHGLDRTASTIHRMLGYDGATFRCPRVDADVVIVDEFSMVDVPLMAALLERIDLGRTQLILVGDHNQLPPVGAGNILRDIIRHRLAPTAILSTVHRQAGLLERNSMRVLEGTVAPSAVEDGSWIVVDCFREALQIKTYLRDLLLDSVPRKLGFDPIRDVQVITPTHKGPLGTRSLNDMMQYLLHGHVPEKLTVGDKVIQTVNDYDLEVMNGTVGHVVQAADSACVVEFEHSGPRELKGEQVHNIQLAYAMTAHRAQGSEFPCVVVVCHKSHFFADRNWFYTAVTRASKTCILVGDRWGLRNAAHKNRTIKRRTFLDLWASEGRCP